jgi:hypothetical protein
MPDLSSTRTFAGDRLRIALVPLDERPVNVALPVGIATIAGAELVLPPATALPDIRKPGNVDVIADWLSTIAGEVDALVVSIDTLVFGGLIAARTTADLSATVLGRLDVLRRIREAHPGLPISAVSLVMRATNSYNPQEEPLYWADHGKEIHHLGALHHRDFLTDLGVREDGGNADALKALRASLPADVLSDFQLRRLRNHQVNLAVLGLASQKVLDTLLITADDTAEHAAGSVEQLWLAQWMKVLPEGATVLMYPGADEVAAVLVARQLALLSGHKAQFTIACAQAGGLERIAKYENSPVETAIARQLAASGAIVTDDESVELLVIHAPDIRRRDFVHDVIDFDEADKAAAMETADLIAEHLGAGKRVALADLRYANGADPLLVNLLIDRGHVLQLSAYGGWNTAGNALGSVVAAAAAIQIGRASGTLDEVAARRMLLHRLAEDFAYQAVVRIRLQEKMDLLYGVRKFPSPAIETETGIEMQQALSALLDRMTGADGARIGAVSFPWHRSFEINFEVLL